MSAQLGGMDFSRLKPDEIQRAIQQAATFLHAEGKYDTKKIMSWMNEYYEQHNIETMIHEDYDIVEGIEEGDLQRDMEKH